MSSGRVAAYLALVCFLSACRAQAISAASTPTVAQRVAVLGQVVNQVQARATSVLPFSQVAAGLALGAGSQLQTGAGSMARLDYPNGSFLRLAPDSDMTLDSSAAQTDEIIMRARLSLGKLWAILSGGTLQVYSPAGVATLRGTRASVEFIPGALNQPGSATLIVTCLEGVCSVQTEVDRQDLHNGEQLAVSANGSQAVRTELASTALSDFLAQNPESIAPAASATLAATQAATAVAVDPSPSPLEATATEPAPSDTPRLPNASPVPTTPSTATTVVVVSTPPRPGIIGQHVVRSGETVFCIARTYGVLPQAIVATNGLGGAGALSVGQLLDIPAAPWDNPSSGPSCEPQFVSPYVTSEPGGASATAAVEAATPVPSTTTGEPTFVSPWANPVNLSNSGSASEPALAVGANGNYYAAWWDRFDGVRLAVYQPSRGWSPGTIVPSIFGATPVPPARLLTAPASWRLLADNQGVLHALWVDSTGHLLHAQNADPASGGTWSAATQLASQVLVWSARVEGSTLHLAYIQSDQDGTLPPGVYYRRLASGAIGWDAQQTLANSPYFRSLPAAEAHLDLAVNDTGQVEVAWDDPQSLRSQFNGSGDDGHSFGGQVALSAADPRVAPSARLLQFLPVHGGFVRLWELAASCNLYQQQLDPQDGNWSAPVRVLDQFPGCLSGSQAFPVQDERMVLWTSLSSGASPENLVMWNGSQWSPSLRADFSFVNAADNRPTSLGCLQSALSDEQIVVLGCDSRGDVWVTASQLTLADLLPALANDWRPPVALFDPGINAGLPWPTFGGNLVQALWPEDLAGNPDQQRLVYSRSDGQVWSPAAPVLQPAQDGPMNMPVIVADPGGWLHAVWSGGPAGQIYYSRSFLRDGASSQGWSPPQALTPRQASGGWPAMVLESNGHLVVIYTLPYNEARGIFQIESSDEGLSWSDARLVFDAVAAGWATVQETQFTVDSAGHMHLMVVRGSLPAAATPLGVYYLRSDDGGRNWTQPEEVGSAGAGYPRLVAIGRGELFRFWVQASSSQDPVWQQWSQDDGHSWSAASQVPGLRDISPNLAVVSDGQGALFLVGIQATQAQSAALFYLRWDGQEWVDRQNLPLGYTADAASGASAILLPSHRLGVFYRVTTSSSPGTGPYIVGYTDRAVPAADLPVLPTLTPTPAPTATPSPSQESSLTPIPTLDSSGQQLTSELPDGKWKPIIATLVVMLVIVWLAFWKLTARHR